MANHLIELMGSPGAATEMVDVIRHAIGDRCAQDRWTVDAQQCFVQTPTIEATQTCSTLLTIEQRNAFDKAIGDALREPQ
jgi:hypothetical protein